MDLREVRVEMSRASGAMITTDDVLASLINFWRQRRDRAAGPDVSGWNSPEDAAYDSKKDQQ